MELHTVMTNADIKTGRNTGVLSFLFEKDDNVPNMPWLTSITDNIDVKDKAADFNLKSFYDYVPTHNLFWFYIGGFTTPTCDEIANWYINQHIIKVNSKQLKKFKERQSNLP